MPPGIFGVETTALVAIICAAVIISVPHEQRRWWCRPWLQKKEKGTLQLMNYELEGDPETFTNFVRMKEETFEELLAMVKPKIERQDTFFISAITARDRLIVTLRYLASGETQRSLHVSCRVGRTSISNIIRETLPVIYNALENYVKMPRTKKEWQDISSQFERKWQYPNCLGALDGKHLVFRAPRSCGSMYYNYKGSHSIVLLAMADANARFTYIDVGTNGRISDGGIFKKSTLYQAIMQNQLNLPDHKSLPGREKKLPHVILGDSAFPLMSTLMKPFPFRNINYRKRIYNYRLSRARRIIENAFEILSNRWRILLNTMNIPPETVIDVAKATIALHNFLLEKSHAEYYIPEEEIDQRYTMRKNLSQQAGVINFNGHHGCLKCETIGEYSYISHDSIFPRTQCRSRTDEGFREKIYGSHHKYDSPLLKITSLDMVKDFPVADSVYLIDLGLMKRLLLGWRNGSFNNYNTKWSARDNNEVSKDLKQIKLPTEIHRAVRGLDQLAFWKGLEFRSFLLYIGPVILKKYLPYDAYEHFLVLFSAVTICTSDFYKHFLDLAENLFEHYIEKFIEIYGIDHITSNIHNLSHIVEDVRRFGKLMSFSAYPFENKLFEIKNLLRSGSLPLAQVGHRIQEKSFAECNNNNNVNKLKFPSLKYKNNGENVQREILNCLPNEEVNFFNNIEFENFIITTKDHNRWFLTSDNKIVCVDNIISHNNIPKLYGCTLRNTDLFFETPIKLSFLNIYCSNLKKNKPGLFFPSKIKCKLVKVNYDDNLSVFIPLLHTLVEQ